MKRVPVKTGIPVKRVPIKMTTTAQETGKVAKWLSGYASV